MPTNRNNEGAIEDDFNDLMREISGLRGLAFRGFSLAGQDAHLNADYIFAGATDFTLVEFKFSENDIQSEDRKLRSQQLCRRLKTDKRLLELHERGHYIAWRDSASGELRSNVYQRAVCLRSSIGVVAADAFCEQFFSPPPSRSLCLEEMVEYLELLNSGVNGENVQLYARAPSTTTSIKLVGLHQAHDFIQQYYQGNRPKGLSLT